MCTRGDGSLLRSVCTRSCEGKSKDSSYWPAEGWWHFLLCKAQPSFSSQPSQSKCFLWGHGKVWWPLSASCIPYFVHPVLLPLNSKALTIPVRCLSRGTSNSLIFPLLLHVSLGTWRLLPSSLLEFHDDVCLHSITASSRSCRRACSKSIPFSL